MRMKKKMIMKCPLCVKSFVHQKYVLTHLVRRHSHPVDLLTWKIPRRKRGSCNKKPAPPPPHEPQIQEMVVFAAAPPPPAPAAMAMGLPVKKRLALIIHMARQHRLYICHVCGHKAQHTLAEKKKDRLREQERNNAGQLVVRGPHVCNGCGPEFESGQGLGARSQTTLQQALS